MPIFMDEQILRPHTGPMKRVEARTKPEKVYDFILEFKRVHDGNSPTIREIVTSCKISSTSMVWFYLNQLAADGLIKRQASNIEVVGGKWIFIGGKHD